MTGAGVARGESELGEVAIEIRSVNGRQIGIKTRLPSSLQGLEHHFEDRIRKAIRRGQVRINAEILTAPSTSDAVVDHARAKAAAEELRQLAAELGMDEPDLEDILAVPGVLSSSTPGSGRISRELPPKLDAVVTEAIDQLVADRLREGAATAADVRAQLSVLDEARAQATQRSGAVVEEYRAKLLDRVNEFLSDKAPALQPEQVVREVALFADRADISEELQRLDAHSTEAHAMLDKGGEVGRRLEFLLQEMLREINTLGSKSPDVEMASTVVTMKATVEKLREQAANLE